MQADGTGGTMSQASKQRGGGPTGPTGKALVADRQSRENSASEARVSERKYRQRGYQDSGTPEKRPSEKPVKKETFGPRPLQMPGTRDVSRCAQCGTLLQTMGEAPERCPKCGFETHSCKQCMYFDPSSRFECSQPIPERIPRKDVKNHCSFYAIRVTREKETTTPSTLKPQDARQAFENLFKK